MPSQRWHNTYMNKQTQATGKSVNSGSTWLDLARTKEYEAAEMTARVKLLTHAGSAKEYEDAELAARVRCLEKFL